MAYDRPLYGRMDPRNYIGAGGINRNAITDPFYLQQLQMGNVDDAGNGTWNTHTGMWSDKQGRQVRQIGDGSGGGYGAMAAGDLLDPKGVWYDEDLGYVTAPENFKERPDDLGAFGHIVKGVIGAGALAGLSGLAGGGGLFGEGGMFSGSTPYGPGLNEGLTFGPGTPYGPGIGDGLMSSGYTGLENVSTITNPLTGSYTAPQMLSAPSLSGGGSGGLLSMIGSGDFSGALSSVGSSIMSNPLQAIGLLQAGSGLINGNKPSGGGSNYNPTSSYNSSNKGGSFTPNQYTANQLQRYQRGMGL